MLTENVCSSMHACQCMLVNVCLSMDIFKGKVNSSRAPFGTSLQVDVVCLNVSCLDNAPFWYI